MNMSKKNGNLLLVTLDVEIDNQRYHLSAMKSSNAAMLRKHCDIAVFHSIPLPKNWDKLSIIDLVQTIVMAVETIGTVENIRTTG
jgi:hypothetical protein